MAADRELDAFQGAFGQHCHMAAEALFKGLSREAVRIAFAGNGENIHLRHLRTHRAKVNELAHKARAALTRSGMGTEEAHEVLIGRMRMSREAVEGEWGRNGETDHNGHRVWQRASLPIGNYAQ